MVSNMQVSGSQGSSARGRLAVLGCIHALMRVELRRVGLTLALCCGLGMGCASVEKQAPAGQPAPVVPGPVLLQQGPLLAQAVPAGNGAAPKGSVGDQERFYLAQQYFKAGQRLYESMRYKEAATQLRLSLNANPEHEEARALLDRTLYILGERAPGYRDQARRYVGEQKVKIQTASMEVDRLYAEGLRYMERREYAQAIDRFERVIETIRYFPYHIDKSGLRAQAEHQLIEARGKEEERDSLLQEQMQKAAREQAAIWEQRNQSYHEAKVRSLFEQAEVAFQRLRFSQCEELAGRLLRLEPGHLAATKLAERARNARHHQAELDRIENDIEGLQRLIEAVYEAAIPYQAIFSFPDEDLWAAVQARTVNLQRAFEQQGQHESAESQRIRKTLDSRKVSINFPGVSFEDAVAYLQKVTGLNYVIAKAAREHLESNEPSIELKLTDITLSNALKIVLAQASGAQDDPAATLVYRIKNDTVWINTKEAERDELFLRFYEVSEIVNKLPDFKAPPLALQPPSGDGGAAGGLTFGGEEEEADTGTGIESEKLKELIEQRLGDSGDSGAVEFLGGLLMVRKSLAAHKKVERLLDQLRRTTGIMVTVETRIISVQDNFLEELGIDFRGLPAQILNFAGTGTNLPVGYNWTSKGFHTDLRGALVNVFSQALGTAAGTPFSLTSLGGGLLQYNLLDDFQLQALLDAARREQQVRNVDSPRLTVFNGQRSHTLSVGQRAYIADVDVNQSGVTPTPAPVVGVLNTGSVLEARPIVSHDRKYVTLEIQPTLAMQGPSTFHRLILNQGATDITIEMPTVNLSQIKTTVMAPDGGTIILGGMKNLLEQEYWSGMPLMRDVPLLHNLFERKGYTDFKHSLIVLLKVDITNAREQERRKFNEQGVVR